MHQPSKGYTDEQIDLIAGLPGPHTEIRETAMFNRRDFLRQPAPRPVSSPSAAVPAAAARPRGHVVVVGGGYGGATAAKYLRMWATAASR